jgi:PadR family transcriptional regulator, regulatory protein PadR
MPPVPPLGEFEMIVLLAVLYLFEADQPAYGSTIRDAIAARANRRVARGAIYVTLDRLESKGLLASRMGDASALRDDRPKRLFKVTPAGLKAVRQAVGLVNRMQEGLEPILHAAKAKS